jgi:hypothetical protein
VKSPAGCALLSFMSHWLLPLIELYLMTLLAALAVEENSY